MTPPDTISPGDTNAPARIGRLPYLRLPAPQATGAGVVLELHAQGYGCRLSYNAATDSQHLVWLDEPPPALRAGLERYVCAMVAARAQHAQEAGHPHAGRWSLLRKVRGHG